MQKYIVQVHIYNYYNIYLYMGYMWGTLNIIIIKYTEMYILLYLPTNNN